MSRKVFNKKDKTLKRFLKNGGRKEARKDFYELLKRAAKLNPKF